MREGSIKSRGVRLRHLMQEALRGILPGGLQRPLEKRIRENHDPSPCVTDPNLKIFGSTGKPLARHLGSLGMQAPEAEQREACSVII